MKKLAILTLGLAMTGLVAGAAQARDWDHDGDGWRHHGYHHHWDRGWGPPARVYYYEPYYRPYYGPVYYRPYYREDYYRPARNGGYVSFGFSSRLD